MQKKVDKRHTMWYVNYDTYGVAVKDSIRIIGLTFSACHGVQPEELTLPQPFEVDVEIKRDLSAAADSDRLDDTIDYSAVVDAVSQAVHGGHCRLVEHLAGRIFRRIEAIIPDGCVVIRVRKPRAPLEIPFNTVEVELIRELGGS